MSLLITPAFAQAAAQGAAENAGPLGGLGQFASLAPIVLVFGVFYFLLMRPQQQRQKQLKATLSALRRGDRVVTAGGIVGVVQRAQEGATEIEVEIAAGVRVRVLRDTITSVLSDTPTAANDSAPEKKAAR
ncbi:MAG: preprotein translocase subunit YajC [Gluconacetobacter diazotrophicus]|nr:preprotein translocase subunit YajC [Gluconacetobacter diazotrophicus]